MASSINFNTVWTSIFEPLPTFGFLERLGRESYWGKRHDQDFHVVGSDASGVVLRVGSAVRNWKPGDRVVVHCNHVDDQDPTSHDDSMLADNQRIWGFETNYGGLADLSVVKANQLMPKPAHLTWEEAAVNALCNSTSYRMLVSQQRRRHEPGRRRARVGRHRRPRRLRRAVRPQRRRHPRRRGVVARQGRPPPRSGRRARHRPQGSRLPVLVRRATQDEKEWRRLGKDIRGSIGRDVDIVFEHPGRQTFGASVFVAARGGTIVTCAATSGYMIEYDNRHLWMKLKRIVSSHFANYAEAWAANQLICEGKIQPILSAVYPLDETGEAAFQVHKNLHEGKIGVLCLAPAEGLGIDDPEFREKVGEDRITLFRRHGA